jgi:hypothetical protein
MTIKDFDKKEWSKEHGIDKFRQLNNEIRTLKKQIYRDSLPGEYYLQIRKKHIKQLQQQLEDLPDLI